MERFLLTCAMVALLGLCVYGMWLGWRRKARAQSVRLPLFPEPPEQPGEQTLPSATGLYVSTTMAGRWQERIVTRGAGLRSAATWRLYLSGLDIERVGAPRVWIPAESMVDARKDRAIAGKVMGTDSLLVITWRLGEHELDTGLRGDDLGAYPAWLKELGELAKSGSENNADLGGAK